MNGYGCYEVRISNFERQTRDIVSLKHKDIASAADIGNLVFLRVSVRAEPGAPNAGPPIDFLIKDFATVTELQKAPTSR